MLGDVSVTDKRDRCFVFISPGFPFQRLEQNLTPQHLENTNDAAVKQTLQEGPWK